MKTLIFSFLCLGLYAQSIPKKLISFKLSDSVEVQAFQTKIPNAQKNAWYYLPTNFRIAEKKGVPEFSFLRYYGESSGAIMHLLLTWGLNEQQQQELGEKIRQKHDSLGMVLGAAPFADGVEASSIEFLNEEEEITNLLLKNATKMSPVPNYENAKMAISFRFNAEDADAVMEAFLTGKKLEQNKIRINFPVFVSDSALNSDKANIKNHSIISSLFDWYKQLVECQECIKQVKE